MRRSCFSSEFGWFALTIKTLTVQFRGLSILMNGPERLDQKFKLPFQLLVDLSPHLVAKLRQVFGIDPAIFDQLFDKLLNTA